MICNFLSDSDGDDDDDDDLPTQNTGMNNQC